jgi:hypothetical protein
MRYFDRFPPSVRRALQNSQFDWALRFWFCDYRAGRVSAPQLVKTIQLADRTRAAITRRKVWGPDYPRNRGKKR